MPCFPRSARILVRMSSREIAGGVVHELPDDLRLALVGAEVALAKWESLTPLARNEWICWVESVKKAETRREHVARAISQLEAGKRRPCCWMGCTHRTDKPLSATQKWLLEKQKKARGARQRD